MSNIYHTEPPTHGKVLLHTSFGDIDIELWTKECPKACRNFVQLALEGYYDNTVFHRVIRKFMVQGGDPTGTGNGGDSIYGKPFRDEIHTRIKFNHRGQVAMANENQENHSQFFFTLENAPHLDKKHTIFGKITGNTIFNALRMGDVDADKDDRPLEPPRLISVEVLLNPFDDITPRNLAGVAGASDEGKAAAAAAAEAKKKKRKKQGKKDFKLLSFGEEADQEEKELEAAQQTAGAGSRGIKSAHDALDDEKFSKDAAYDVEAERKAADRQKNAVAADESLRKAIKTAAKGAKREKKKESATDDSSGDPTGPPPHAPDFDEGDAFMDKMRRQMMEKKKALEKSLASKATARADDSDEDHLDFEADEEEEEEEEKGKKEDPEEATTGWRAGEGDDETDKEKARKKAIKERAKEYEALREELKAKHRAARVMTGQERLNYDAEHLHREMLSPVEQMRAKYKKRRKEAGTREDSTMAKLAMFTSAVRTTKKRVNTEDKEDKKVEAYHGQVTEGKLYEGEDDADDGEDWFAGPLKFKRHIDDDLRKGSDGRRADDYAVIDPLKQEGSGRGNGARGGGQGREDFRNGSSSGGGGGRSAGGREDYRNGGSGSGRTERRNGIERNWQDDKSNGRVEGSERRRR